jgi:RimJ/RimL family protein N-acetyltransferase
VSDIAANPREGGLHVSGAVPTRPAQAELSLGDLRLRPWCEADASALCAACQDPEITRWVSVPEPFSLADALDQITEWRAMWEDGSGAPLAIVDASSDRLMGAIVRFGPDGHQATLGCWIVPEARGRGIGTRVLRHVADWTFQTTDVMRIDAYIMVGNVASERMAQRAGFQREGVLRAWDLLRGTPVDCVSYSRLRDDA